MDLASFRGRYAADDPAAEEQFCRQVEPAMRVIVRRLVRGRPPVTRLERLIEPLIGHARQRRGPAECLPSLQDLSKQLLRSVLERRLGESSLQTLAALGSTDREGQPFPPTV